MNLHRSTGKPDWATVPTQDWNTWQRLAACTSGALTPGNAFTVLGLLLVFFGLFLVNQHHYAAGLVAIAFGRLCDLWDGMIAEATGTKSPLGEKLDAGFDKLASVAAFVFLIVAHIVPVSASLLIFLPNLSNAFITLLSGRRGIVLHPSRYGKLFMAAGWVAIVSFVLAVSFSHKLHAPFTLIGYVFAVLSFLLGGMATNKYYQVFTGKSQ